MACYRPQPPEWHIAKIRGTPIALSVFFQRAAKSGIFTDKDLFICARSPGGRSRGVIIFHEPRTPIPDIPTLRLLFRPLTPEGFVKQLKRMKQCLECAFSGDSDLIANFPNAPLMFRLLVTARAYDAKEGLPEYTAMRIDDSKYRKFGPSLTPASSSHSLASPRQERKRNSISLPPQSPESGPPSTAVAAMDAVFGEHLCKTPDEPSRLEY